MSTQDENEPQLREALAALRPLIYRYQPWKSIPVSAYTAIPPELYNQASGYVRIGGLIIAVDPGPAERQLGNPRLLLYSLLTEDDIGEGQRYWNHDTEFHAWEPDKFRSLLRYVRSFG